MKQKKLSNLKKWTFLCLMFGSLSALTQDHGEVILESEAEDGMELGKLFVAKSKKEKKQFNITAKRGSNSYGHGCMRANFEILSNIDDNLKHGIFADGGKKYEALLRFSNPSYDKEDSEKTFRGVGIKLFGVGGKKIYPPGMEDHKNQDFLLVAYPEFPIANASEFREFMEALIHHKNPIWFFIPSVYKPWTWRFRQFDIFRRSRTYQPRTHLFEHSFFSILPFALGDQQEVRYRIKPCGTYPKKYSEGSGKRFFRDRMQEHLNSYDACFNFSVQLRKEGMGVEDATEWWDTSKSPYIDVARITIPKQNFVSDDKLNYCVATSYNPWNTTEEHRPLGSLNRARRAAYIHSLKHREADNDYKIEHVEELPELFKK